MCTTHEPPSVHVCAGEEKNKNDNMTTHDCVLHVCYMCVADSHSRSHASSSPEQMLPSCPHSLSFSRLSAPSFHVCVSLSPSCCHLASPEVLTLSPSFCSLSPSQTGPSVVSAMKGVKVLKVPVFRPVSFCFCDGGPGNFGSRPSFLSMDLKSSAQQLSRLQKAVCA